MASRSNKTALVTGGNKGIGFAICKGLLDAGYYSLSKLALNCFVFDVK